MRIGIVVENFEKVPHETEQINALVLMREINKFGHEAVILCFNKGGSVEGGEILDFSEGVGGKFDGFYLSGRVSLKNFVRLVWVAIKNRVRVHFRIPSYNLKSFKKKGFLLKILIKLNLLSLYCFDEIHEGVIKRELGIDTKILEPCVNIQDFRRDKKIKKNVDVLFIGSYDDYRRGLPELLRAVKTLKNEIPNVKLKVINRYGIYTSEGKWNVVVDGKRVDIRKKILNLVKDLGLEENVVFSGKVEDIYEEYRRARVYVLPVKDFEYMPPIPYSILESLYFGTPVIASDYYGVGLILDEKFLVGRGVNAGEIAKKILWVLKNKPRVSLDEKFLPENSARKFLGFVEG